MALARRHGRRTGRARPAAADPGPLTLAGPARPGCHEDMGARRIALCLIMGAAPWIYLALLRSWQLRWGTTPEEAHRDLPGDDLVAHPMFEATRAVTIAAAPDQVWPWIIQMGTGRGGYYALDVVDNAWRRSAARIRPDLQHLAVGDVMPTDPGGAGFTVTRLEPARLLVLHMPQAAVGPAQGSVAVIIALAATGDGRTRLLCRLRADTGPQIASRMYGLLLEIGDFVMMRLMLAGIKTRAEKQPEQAVAHATAGPGDAQR